MKWQILVCLFLGATVHAQGRDLPISGEFAETVSSALKGSGCPSFPMRVAVDDAGDVKHAAVENSDNDACIEAAENVIQALQDAGVEVVANDEVSGRWIAISFERDTPVNMEELPRHTLLHEVY